MNRIARALILSAGAAVLSAGAYAQTVILTTPGSAATENFDTLAATGTSSTLPAGWYFLETGTNANTSYTAGDGTSNAGNTYSFGTGSNAERAFGSINSGTLIPTIGARFSNNTGVTLGSLAIAYTGEQWRVGQRSIAVVDQLDFQYSLDAGNLGTGTWTDVNALDFISPINLPTDPLGNELDGNAAPNRTAIGATIVGLAIAPGANFWLRWNAYDATGIDDGLAIDDFSITPFGATVGGGGDNGGGENGTGIPEPSTLALFGFGLLGLTVLYRPSWQRGAKRTVR